MPVSVKATAIVILVIYSFDLNPTNKNICTIVCITPFTKLSVGVKTSQICMSSDKNKIHLISPYLAKNRNTVLIVLNMLDILTKHVSLGSYQKYLF